MKIVKVYSQAEFDAAIADPNEMEIWICGAGRFVVRLTPDQKRVIVSDTAIAVLRGSSHAVLRESSHAVLWESSHAVLWESSHAVLRESSHAVLRESSHAVLWESSHAVLWESSHAVLRESSHAVLWGLSHAVLWGLSHAVLRESSHAVLRGSSHAVLRESSHAVLWGSSHAVLRGSSHAVLRESSHAVLWGSSHADAAGASSVTAFDWSQVKATKYVAIQKRDKRVTITGDGLVIEVPPITTAEQWCEFYGVTVIDGIATLFKGVRDDYHSSRGFLYTPGTAPTAPDWDPEPECGGGLHFCATPLACKEFDDRATKFLACQVALVDIAVHHPAQYPSKVKARAICAPIVEVDRYGEPLAAGAIA